MKRRKVSKELLNTARVFSVGMFVMGVVVMGIFKSFVAKEENIISLCLAIICVFILSNLIWISLYVLGYRVQKYEALISVLKDITSPINIEAGKYQCYLEDRIFSFEKRHPLMVKVVRFFENG